MASNIIINPETGRSVKCILHTGLTCRSCKRPVCPCATCYVDRLQGISQTCSHKGNHWRTR